ncbi:membrane protein [Latilactobacillus sakei]|uniref:GtrA family protein n=1 Tax=Latilactobacillus sakei TaxID=1599 RepID=A0AAX0VBV2_LATSK|nr:GtrA family protein [Latilactobacillus sakei]PKX72010.1 GtrA family protein [Latilactobacillus sakei]PKX79091.1 GtrA family protein [Latilactobacillus sakei]SOB39647.1 Cell wall teichoic acid glycosylation protein GtcA [Latilactobacillus sakei]BAX67760.1 teichoic acid glycosylation protein [Latilactobacillus sakei]GEA77145.1 membrane protein [Latilactobacillus sakei]
MIKTIQNLIHKYWEQLMYLVFGVLTTAVNMVVFYLLDQYTGMYYLLSNTIAWFLSVLFAFFTNKTWVFQSKYTTFRDFSRELASFFFFRGISYIMDTAIMFVGISMLHGPNMVVKIIDQFVIILANYIFSKWIFNKSTEA